MNEIENHLQSDAGIRVLAHRLPAPHNQPAFTTRVAKDSAFHEALAEIAIAHNQIQEHRARPVRFRLPHIFYENAMYHEQFDNLLAESLKRILGQQSQPVASSHSINETRRQRTAENRSQGRKPHN